MTYVTWPLRNRRCPSIYYTSPKTVQLNFKFRTQHRRRLSGCRGCQCTQRQRVGGCHAPKGKIVKNTIRKKCVHCGQLILRKISKIGATRCQILMLKCTKFDFRWGSAPDPAGGAYRAPPDRLTVFKGPTSKGMEGERREGKRRGKGKGRGGKEGRDGKGKEGKGGKKGGMGVCTHWDFRKSAPMMSSVRRPRGRLFQVRGPAAPKLLSPKLLC